MSYLLCCPRGHQWQTVSNSGAPPTCPVCGATGQTIVSNVANDCAAVTSREMDELPPPPRNDLSQAASVQLAATSPYSQQAEGGRTFAAKGASSSEAPTSSDRGGQVAGTSLPKQIGRYRVQRVLGRGGFGIVYLGYDEQLHRQVAIKVPRRERLLRGADAESYLAEARTLARLDHPSIVPVYDVGLTEGGLYYVVSKYVEGRDLEQLIADDPPNFTRSVMISMAVAEALDYAHSLGLVHRDIKPANVLINAEGNPVVADFGLALREDDSSDPGLLVGTPAYMSPEQARGEGHRVDRRSDIYSLGVVFYQLLTRRLPFRASSGREVLEQVKSAEVQPPRQLQENVPAELDRICLKCLSKRAADRYSTARELADDLRHYLHQSRLVHDTGAGGTLENQPMVVHKGLHAFDENDADFFLDLLPGPRDRSGLPESIRFWKQRTEEIDADKTFRVGVIYGPSGCGKSSLARAALVPRLAQHVIPVYLEATPTGTEDALRKLLNKRVSELAAGMSLAEQLKSLRCGHILPAGRKILIVLDQFEQWLHVHHDTANAELAAALRQCDGGRVQCLLVIRDDYWMAATRFLRELEVPLAENHNAAAVDLFDLSHARRVLAEFGRSLGLLPANLSQMSQDQETFLNQAVAALADEQKVIPIRLAVLAEMMKGRPWNPATLRRIGGAHGVGVAFLEETFSAATAPREYRTHEKAVQAVLDQLLPEAGQSIKGRVRTRRELRKAARYDARVLDFDALMRILVSDTRLLTPVEKEGSQARNHDASPDASQFYQLTHDFLVPSLREWLTQKQKTTRRGRAEIRLRERSEWWDATRRRKQLPSLIEWLGILLLTSRSRWAPREREMMHAAGRVHALRASLITLAVVAGSWIAYQIYGAARGQMLVHALTTADTANVPALVRQFARFRSWSDAHLARIIEDPASPAKDRLHARLALLPVDSSQWPELFTAMLSADPETLLVLRNELDDWRPALQKRAEELWDSGSSSATARFNGAALLNSGNSRWADAAEFVANQLVARAAAEASAEAALTEVFHPLRDDLQSTMAEVFRDGDDPTSRLVACRILADWFQDQAPTLIELLADAEPDQFRILMRALRASHQEEAIRRLTASTETPPSTTPTGDDTDVKRHANRLMALALLDSPERLWNALRHTSDDSVRTTLIDRLAAVDIDPRMLVGRLQREADVGVRRGLYLSLGGYSPADHGRVLIDELTQGLQLLSRYQTCLDPGEHSAIQWLLRQWNLEIPQVSPGTEADASLFEGTDGKNWYVTSQGHSLAVFFPAAFAMGSPEDEPGRDPDFETLHHRRIDRVFAIGMHEVTFAEYERFRPRPRDDMHDCRQPDCPVNWVMWSEAAAYCNWLSEQEGTEPTQFCYRQVSDEPLLLEPADGYLSRTGYRLPTEAEWEYACRGGTTTARFFGQSDHLLAEYAWCPRNSPEGKKHAVGLKKPNEFGLFDVYGNALEWCNDFFDKYPQGGSHPDQGGPGPLASAGPDPPRVLRGQAAGDLPPARSAARDGAPFKNLGLAAAGFRIARTLKVTD